MYYFDRFFLWFNVIINDIYVTLWQMKELHNIYN